MPRYILIDNVSGYIFGDTADYAPDRQHELTPILAARLLDERVVGEFSRTYAEHADAALNETGYQVWRADVDGSEPIPIVHDGQNEETIAAVYRECHLVAFILVQREPIAY